MPKKLINWECWDEYNLESEMYDEILAELEEDSLEDLPEEQLILMSKIPKLVTTPMGMFQLHDKMSPLSQFDCWTAHTNFNLTKSVSKQIEKVAGVELFSIQSRYRFFVGIGKMFSFPQVRKDIETTLNVRSPILTSLQDIEDEEETETAIEVLKEVLNKDKHWAIYVSPDGIIDYISTNANDDEKFLGTVIKYEFMLAEHGGSLHQNEQENRKS